MAAGVPHRLLRATGVCIYRLSPTKDKMWNLYRANSVDSPNGSLIGKYQRRGDASKVVAQVAYQPNQL